MIEIKVKPPGEKAKKIVLQDKNVMSDSLKKDSPFVAVKGEGIHVWDIDGNKYMDLTAGISVCNVGHCHPKIVEAIKNQSEKLIHISSDFYNPLQVELAKKLSEITPGDYEKKVFLTNSGTESVECALKAARYHSKRPRFISFIGAFHGRSMGSLSLTGSKTVHRKYFSPMLSEVSHMPYAHCYRCLFKQNPEDCSLECIEYMRNAFKTYLPPEEVAAMFLEPIQGEGGYIVPKSEFVKEVSRIALEYGMLLVVDEIQSGFGRSGKMFAIEHFDVEPDVTTLAKSMASGIPIGACVARKELMEWKVGAHGNTFGGNPVASAAALSTIKVIEKEGLVRNSERIGKFILKRVHEMQENHALIGDVRGKGLMIGMEFVKDVKTKEYAKKEASYFVNRALERGLVMLSAGYSAVRLAPPLIIKKEEAETALNIIDEVFGETEKRFLY
ncbi:MAG: acetyl ornithine aminotransferase family protein [Candidatus Methanofastidiosia archaeon]